MSTPLRREDVLVQPILLTYTPEARAIDVVEQVALASATMIQHLAAHNLASPEYMDMDTWLNGSMTKSVRRISRAKLNKLHDDENTRDAWRFAVGATPAFDPEDHGPVVIAAAGVVTTYANMLSVAKHGQVSFEGPVPMVGEFSTRAHGHDIDDDHAGPEYVVHLDGELGMSVGKMSAQAAHALSHLATTMAFDHRGVSFIVEDTATMRDLTDDALVVIHDNGLTEIPAGSLTALVTQA